MKKYLAVLIIVVGNFATTIAQSIPEFVSGKIECTINNMGLNVNGTMTGLKMQFNQTSDEKTTN